MNIKKVFEWAYNFSKHIITLLGLMWLMVFIAEGVVHGALRLVDDMGLNVDLSAFTQDKVLYMFAVVLIVYMFGTIYVGVKEFIKIFKTKKVEDGKVDNESKFIKFLKWLRDN